jgi:predicted acylesterase/phospholipase RssA
MTIKHTVISGGGPTGISTVGTLQHLEESGFWKHDDLESIYSTSIGSVIAVLLAMRFDWTTINDYIIKRPWKDVYKISVNDIFDAYSKKGVFDGQCFDVFFKPFFDAQDISLDITTLEFYERFKIELHFFALELNNFELTNISYKTFPNIRLLTAIHMSCALPLVITPVIMDGACYVDGGVVCNYPLSQCVEEQNLSEKLEEILGLKNEYENVEKNNHIVTDASTIMEYSIHFISILMKNASFKNTKYVALNEVKCVTESMTLDYLTNALESVDVRKELLETGVKSAQMFLNQEPEPVIKLQFE